MPLRRQKRSHLSGRRSNPFVNGPLDIGGPASKLLRDGGVLRERPVAPRDHRRSQLFPHAPERQRPGGHRSDEEPIRSSAVASDISQAIDSRSGCCRYSVPSTSKSTARIGPRSCGHHRPAVQELPNSLRIAEQDLAAPRSAPGPRLRPPPEWRAPPARAKQPPPFARRRRGVHQHNRHHRQVISRVPEHDRVDAANTARISSGTTCSCQSVPSGRRVRRTPAASQLT